MFSRIIRRSVPVSGIYRSSCNKSSLATKSRVQLDLLLASSNARYVSSSCTLLYSKQNTKKKTKVVDSEKSSVEDDKLKNETNSKPKSKKKAKVVDSEKPNLEEELKNETNGKKKTKKKRSVVDSEKQEVEKDKIKNGKKERAKKTDSATSDKTSKEAQSETTAKFSDESDKKKESAQQADSAKSEKASEKAQQESEEFDEEAEDKDSDKKEKGAGPESIFGSDMVIHSFANAERKEKETFLECLRMYQNAPGRKIERVPFIYAALKYMDEFGVAKDLAVYKALIDIFPKEKMIPTNLFQTMFVHYPREQYCATTILEKMEDNGVMPDPEMELLLLSIFGRHGMPLEKYWKIMYWMPKFRHLNPWPVPKPIPNDALELAKLAMQKISSIDILSEVTELDTNDVKDSIDKTWIVSAMAPKQSELLVKHDKTKAIYVEGPFKIYVATKSVDYFTLRTDPDLTREFPIPDLDAVDQIRNPYLETHRTEVIIAPSVHEQHDSTVFANCATGTSTKDSLLSWIRLLQVKNPVLNEIPVIFRLTNLSKEKLYIECGAETPLPSGEETEEVDDGGDKKLLEEN